jgi:quinol monooxygenase YgiN
MHLRVVSLWVKPNQVEAFVAASLLNVEQTVREPGVLSFALLQQRDTPGHFLVVEAYRSDEDRTAHLRTEWFRVWRAAVAPMLAEPLDSQRYDPIFPIEAAWGRNHHRRPT